MMPPTRAGTRCRVSADAPIITVKARGTVHAAGWATSGAAQSGAGAPTTVHQTAVTAAPPPATMPAAAPGAVRPRHQIPSTSSGQKLEAATANASPTTVDTFNPDIRSASTIGTNPAISAATRKPRTEPRPGPSTSVESTPAT